jgi:hypothetical protein
MNHAHSYAALVASRRPGAAAFSGRGISAQKMKKSEEGENPVVPRKMATLAVAGSGVRWLAAVPCSRVASPQRMAFANPIDHRRRRHADLPTDGFTTSPAGRTLPSSDSSSPTGWGRPADEVGKSGPTTLALSSPVRAYFGPLINRAVSSGGFAPPPSLSVGSGRNARPRANGDRLLGIDDCADGAGASARRLTGGASENFKRSAQAGGSRRGAVT